MARVFAIIPAAAILAGATVPTASIDLSVTGLRSARGLIHICLTRTPAHFPHCEKDKQAITRSASATATNVEIRDLPPGTYAVAIFHDENSNRKLDKFMGIPREGFGFSRSPVVRFGPPKFEQVSIQLRPGLSRQGVRMQYIL